MFAFISLITCSWDENIFLTNSRIYLSHSTNGLLHNSSSSMFSACLQNSLLATPYVLGSESAAKFGKGIRTTVCSKTVCVKTFGASFI